MGSNRAENKVDIGGLQFIKLSCVYRGDFFITSFSNLLNNFNMKMKLSISIMRAVAILFLFPAVCPALSRVLVHVRCL